MACGIVDKDDERSTDQDARYRGWSQDVGGGFNKMPSIGHHAAARRIKCAKETRVQLNAGAYSTFSEVS